MFERLIWVVPAATALLGIWRPRAAVLAFVAALPLFGSPPGGPYLGALDVTALAVILTSWRAGPRQRAGLDRPLLAVVAVGAASLLPLAYLPPSWRPSSLVGLLAALPGVEAWTGLFTWRALANLLLGWGLYDAVRRTFAGRSIRPIGVTLAASLGLLLLIGLTGRAGLVDLAAYRPGIGVSAPIRRFYSLFFNSGWLAEYIVIAAPLGIAALATGRRLARVCAALLIALSLGSLILTQQRGGWLAAFVVLAVLAWLRAGSVLRDRRRASRLAAAAAVVSLLVVAIPTLSTLGRENRPRDISIQKRLSTRTPLWEASVEMLRARPASGWGLGAFAPAYDLQHPRGSPGARRFRETAHNLYFHVAAEQGLLGLAALGLLAWAVMAGLRRPGPEGDATLALGVGLALLAAAVYGLTQYVFYIKNIAWLIWILLACAAAPPGAGRGPSWRERTAWALVALALLLVPVRLAAGEPPRLAGNRAYGFHEVEAHASGELEWTEGRAARRVAWEGETLVLVFANGHPQAARRPVEVRVRIDGRVVGEWTIPGGWQEHRVEVGRPRRDWLEVGIEARPTFRPFTDYRRYPEVAGSWDIRSLGIVVRPFRWEAAVSETAGAGR